MNISKRAIFFLAGLLCFSLLLVSCGNKEKYDENTFYLLASSAEGKPGDTVTITVSLLHNPGIQGFSFCLRCVDSEGNEAAAVTMKNREITMEDKDFSYIRDDTEGSGVNFGWTSLTPFTKDGEICQITYQIAEDAAPGSYQLQLLFRDGYDSFYQLNTESDQLEVDVAVTVENGSITVTN